MPTEKVLLGVITGIGMFFATIASVGALVARWRNAWAIERLARGLRISAGKLAYLAAQWSLAADSARAAGGLCCSNARRFRVADRRIINPLRG